MSNRLRFLSRQLRSDSERGQALVLIALAFIGLAAFIGLTVDAGILFSHIGHLRRATDAASLAAANQFREESDPAELSNMAFEMLELNGLFPDPLDVVAEVCHLGSPDSFWDDASLCPGGTNPPSGPDTLRKYVRVTARLQVNFAFLPIIGWDSTMIEANSISEAASIDLVLVIDVSPSMSYDLCHDDLDNDEDGTIDDCASNIAPNPDPTATGPANSPGLTNSESDVARCIANALLPDDDGAGEDVLQAAPDGDREDDCHPFEAVQDASKLLVDRMYFPYDRISIVTFAAATNIPLELDPNTPPAAPCGLLPGPQARAECVIDSLNPEIEKNYGVDCAYPPDPSGCPSTATGDGLKYAGGRFCIDKDVAPDPGFGVCDRDEMREEAVWITILLTDGAANAGVQSQGPPTVWICPSSTWVAPFCRDASASSRHAIADANYDADDYAHDMADFVGCPDPSETQPPDGSCNTTAPGGQGVVIFAIGLGDLVINNPVGDPDAGERLLRYVAAVGDDGIPSTDPCDPPGPPPAAPSGDDCGNYYFSPTGAGLIQVFEAIASRIFTRITH